MTLGFACSRDNITSFSLRATACLRPLGFAAVDFDVEIEFQFMTRRNFCADLVQISFTSAHARPEFHDDKAQLISCHQVIE